MSFDIRSIMNEIEAELTRATTRFPRFRSAHEGEAIVREEMDELTHAVRHESGEAQYKEAKQLAAMAARFMLDIGTHGAEKPNDTEIQSHPTLSMIVKTGVVVCTECGASRHYTLPLVHRFPCSAWIDVPPALDAAANNGK